MIKEDWGEGQEVDLTPEENEAAWTLTEPIRKECQSCFNIFETNSRWAQRCPICKLNDAPKRKKLINDTKDLPF